MADSYQPTYWVDNSTPSLNAANLRKLEKGIADAHGIADGTIGSTGAVDRIVINDGAGHYLQIPSLTTAERDALTAANGAIIYNNTLKCLQARRDGAWVDLHAGAIREDLNLNGKRITSLGTPASDSDAATKQYVDLRPASSAIVANAYLSGASWYRTDAAKPAWMVEVDAVTDLCRFFRAPAGSGAISWTEVLQVGSNGLRPRICVASNEIRYESLASASASTSYRYGPETMTLKSKRIPSGSLYFFSENNQMSVRVTAQLTYTYGSYPNEHPPIQFWITVDGVARWSKTVLANAGSEDISVDLDVNPNSLVTLGASRVEGSAYHSSTVSAADFRIRASDQFIIPVGW